MPMKRKPPPMPTFFLKKKKKKKGAGVRNEKAAVGLVPGVHGSPLQFKCIWWRFIIFLVFGGISAVIMGGVVPL